jgi:hypothetical protein
LEAAVDEVKLVSMPTKRRSKFINGSAMKNNESRKAMKLRILQT